MNRRLAAALAALITASALIGAAHAAETAAAIPLIDLDAQSHRQVIVDREAGQYLGHPTTVLLEDGQTMLCVYPKGHGRGAIVYKRSTDGGRTWSERLPTPACWATSQEVPTLHRVVDAAGKKRLILWSGLYPARLAVSGRRRADLVRTQAGRRLGRHCGDGVGRGPEDARPLPGHVPRRRAVLCG